MPASDLDPTLSARLRSTTARPSPAPRQRPAKVWILESSTPLPHMDSRSPAFTALLRKHNTRVSYVGNHAALLLCGPHATHRSTSLTSLKAGSVLSLNFRRPAPQLA